MCWASEHSPFYSSWQWKANLKGKAMMTVLSTKTRLRFNCSLSRTLANSPPLWQAGKICTIWQPFETVTSKASTAQPERDKQTLHVRLLLHTTRLLIVQKLTVPPKRAFTDVQRHVNTALKRFKCNLGTNYRSLTHCVRIYTHTHVCACICTHTDWTVAAGCDRLVHCALRNPTSLHKGFHQQGVN